MPEQVTFKTAVFGGFNKDDVLKYIDSQAVEFASEEERLNREAQELHARLTETNGGAAELGEAYEGLRREFIVLQGQLSAANAQIKSQQDGMEKLRAEGEQQEKELAILREQNRLLAEAGERKAAQAEEARRRMEEVLNAPKPDWSGTLGEVSESARIILSGTQVRAKDIIAEAGEAAGSVNVDIDGLRAEVARIKDFVNDSMQVLVKRLDYIDRSAEKARLESTGRDAAEAEIEKQCAELIENVNRKLAALAESCRR